MADTAYSLVRANIPYAGTSVSRFYWWQEGVKQKPVDVSRPLFYRMTWSRVTHYDASSPSLLPDVNSSLLLADAARTLVTNPWSSVSDNFMLSLYNRAYAKALDKLGSGADLGTMLAERSEAVSMIASRAIQIRSGWTALRRGNFRKFLKTFQISPRPKHRKTAWTRPKDAAGLWLEYWFGWAPTVNDIYNAVDVLQSPIPKPLIVRASATGTWEKTQKWVYPYMAGSCVCSGTIKLRLQYEAAISNPNLYIANQLGLVNPASVAWNVAPFSFLWDWFGNVGQVLSGFTDFVGVTVTKPQFTRYANLGSNLFQSDKGPPASHRNVSAEYTFMRRDTFGVPMPQSTFNIPKALSVTRALTAISLLVSTRPG